MFTLDSPSESLREVLQGIVQATALKLHWLYFTPGFVEILSSTLTLINLTVVTHLGIMLEELIQRRTPSD